MLDQYRYQKKYPDNSQPEFGRVFKKISLSKKALAASSLISVGVLILGYLTVYYSSYILATSDGSLPALLLKSATDWGEKGQLVLGIKKENQLVFRNFQISIPALKIKEAEVTTNVVSDKKEAYLPILDESIAHYKGTSLPGQEGNSFLYGHSILPQFFNTNDYLTIFSTLHKVKEGDEVLVDYGGKEYKYLVFSKEVVDPEDLDVIDKSGEGSKTMTLMTCSPPGTYLKRLLVTAKMVE